MAGYDYRTKPETENNLSFYLFDNLKMQVDGEGGNVYRFDTMQEAIASFRTIGAEHPTWTIALGGSVGGEHEIDFVQRRSGANVLVDDYQKIDFWANRPDVAQAVEQFAAGPGIEWQTNRKLLFTPVLVPYAKESHDDPILADKALLPTDSNPLTGIAEAYVEGKGWMNMDDLRQQASKEFFEKDKEYPRVVRLNVAYERMDNGATGYVDIKPSELQGMLDRFRELSDMRGQRLEDRLTANHDASLPSEDGELPNTGKPFLDYDTSYGETEKVNIEIATYVDNDNIYVGMSYFDPEIGGMDHYGDITVNIIKLPPLMAAIDTNNNNAEKIMDFLMDHGFGEPTGGALPSGFCMYPVFRFNAEKLAEVNPHGFEQHCKDAGVDLKRESLESLKEQAKERAQGKNTERPAKTPRSQDFER